MLLSTNLLTSVIMKGIVFVGFFELVEKEFGYEMEDRLIEECDLKSEGIYTAVGTYEHNEMVKLVTKLSEHSGLSVPVLLKTYAQYFGKAHLRKYSAFYDNAEDTFAFLESIDGHIHVEVKKLYPDAELPRFTSSRPSENTLELIYSSVRKMSAFAEGLIQDTALYYGEEIDIAQTLLEADGSKVKFTITKR